jgi:hypothetical protein
MLVFIDNLPIEITEHTILELYSRLGSLSVVEIFNQRPDLDPGPLSPTKIALRRKERLKSVSARKRFWERPKTPVYALLQFHDPDAYRLAVDASLRIFGMIYNKHAIRSIQVSAMTKLYLENLPSDQVCSSLEFAVHDLLRPDLLVSLDAKQDRKTYIGSAEIRFESFEEAYKSYDIIKNSGILSTLDCRLNWIRSPKDAEKWWTRALGFD